MSAASCCCFNVGFADGAKHFPEFGWQFLGSNCHWFGFIWEIGSFVDVYFVDLFWSWVRSAGGTLRCRWVEWSAKWSIISNCCSRGWGDGARFLFLRIVGIGFWLIFILWVGVGAAAMLATLAGSVCAVFVYIYECFPLQFAQQGQFDGISLAPIYIFFSISGQSLARCCGNSWDTASSGCKS